MNTVVNGSRHIKVDNYRPDINIGMSGALHGMLRYTAGNFQVYDGYNWINIQPQHATVELELEAVRAIDWVNKKIEAEKCLTALAEKNPQIKEAINAYLDARSKLDVILTLLTNKGLANEL